MKESGEILSASLEQTLHRALGFAAERRHEYATLEHLLLGLVDDGDASAMLRACVVDLDRLRADVTGFLDRDLAGLATDRPGDPKPTAGFQRVVQRAAINVQSSGRDEVTGANVLVALFSERESHAAYFLQSHGMTRLDAVNFISHGLAKAPGRGGQPRPEQPRDAAAPDTADRQPPENLSANLEKTLHCALGFAAERKHEYATLEHLLLGLADDPDASTVLAACGVDLDRLRADLIRFLDKDLAGLATDPPNGPKPTAGVERVLHRSAMHVKSSGRDEVNGANVLIALFSERESHAVYFLQSQDMTRLDAVNFLSHGISKVHPLRWPQPEQRPGAASSGSPEGGAGRTGRCRVVMHKDQSTPMEFVAGILERVFGKSRDDTLWTMLELHLRGVGVCGVFPREVAEAKVGQVMDLARQNRHPLMCNVEME